MTELLRVPPTAVSVHPAVVSAARALRRGRLVAFPTETVYGLGANGLDPDAVGRIFAAKGRPPDNPLILHVESLAAAEELVAEMPTVARRLAEAFWPGPLTMVLRRRACVPDVVSAGLPTVAVRVPAHPVALSLIRAAGVPVAAPSANKSGKPSPTTAAHVMADLDGLVDVVLDSGPTAVGLESTVIDLSLASPRLLRPGGVTFEDLTSVLGRGVLELAGEGEAERPAAPGMKYRHYAPAAPLTVVTGHPAEVASIIRAEMRAAGSAGRRLAALVFSETLPLIPAGGLVLDLGSRSRPEMAGRRLFAHLRACDQERVDGILVEGTTEEGMGRAVMNRLLKAAGGRVLRAGEGKACVDG